MGVFALFRHLQHAYAIVFVCKGMQSRYKSSSLNGGGALEFLIIKVRKERKEKEEEEDRIGIVCCFCVLRYCAGKIDRDSARGS